MKRTLRLSVAIGMSLCLVTAALALGNKAEDGKGMGPAMTNAGELTHISPESPKISPKLTERVRSNQRAEAPTAVRNRLWKTSNL